MMHPFPSPTLAVFDFVIVNPGVKGIFVQKKNVLPSARKLCFGNKNMSVRQVRMRIALSKHGFFAIHANLLAGWETRGLIPIVFY